jgi:hypothetical protein
MVLHTLGSIDVSHGRRPTKINRHLDHIRQLDLDRFERVVAAFGNIDRGRRVVGQDEDRCRAFFVVEDAKFLYVRRLLEGKGHDSSRRFIVRVRTVPVLADDEDVALWHNVLEQSAGGATNADAGSAKAFVRSAEIQISARWRCRIKDHGVGGFRFSTAPMTGGFDLDAKTQVRHHLAGRVVFKVDNNVGSGAQGQRLNLAVEIGHGARFLEDDHESAHLRHANVHALVAVVAPAGLANLRHRPIHRVYLDLDVHFCIEETDRFDEAWWVEKELEAATVGIVVRVRGFFVFGDDQDVALWFLVGKDRAHSAAYPDARSAKVFVGSAEVKVTAGGIGRVEDHGLAGKELVVVLARLDFSNDADSVAEIRDHITRLEVGEVHAGGIGSDGGDGGKAQEGKEIATRHHHLD